MIKKSIYITIIAISTLIFLEFFLDRAKMIKKGQIFKFEAFSENENLDIYPFYSTDEDGILKLDPIITDTLKAYYLKKNEEKIKEINTADNILTILREFRDLEEAIYSDKLNKMNGSEFENYAYSTIKTNNNEADLIKDYIHYPFNSDGFRSIDFYKSICGKKKIMLVGDSFVWGMSSKSCYNSFADILMSRGHLIYNLGIIGTDPAQYEAVVKKYAPIIHPDIIIVSFYEGNDYMSLPRTPKQNNPLEHFTNIGFIDAYPLGKYLTPDEALSFYRKLSVIPNTKNNGFNNLCSKTLVGTLLWRFLFKIKAVKHPLYTEYYNNMNKLKSEKAIFTKPYLENINTFALQNNIDIIFSFIPEKPGYNQCLRDFLTENDQEKALKIIFENIQYFKPNNLKESDYEKDGGIHFINSGSAKYANFLDSLIKAKHLNY